MSTDVRAPETDTSLEERPQRYSTSGSEDLGLGDANCSHDEASQGEGTPPEVRPSRFLSLHLDHDSGVDIPPPGKFSWLINALT